jgi:EAL domain-containing protein (putative c-di-GMP-specific phosphodiesterase class I)
MPLASSRRGAQNREELRSPLCFIVDDEVGVGRFIALALRSFGVAAEYYADIPSMNEALAAREPDLIFLDVALGDSDAVDAIRLLSDRRYAGIVQLMSGRLMLEDVLLIGERHGLRMRPPLMKPFRAEAIKRIVDEERLLHRAPESRSGPGPHDGEPRIDLNEALERGWVRIWYQPKLDLRHNYLAGAEGLARVHHPEHGMMLPETFLPDADPLAMNALAAFGLRQAVRDAAEFADVGFHVRFSLNVRFETLTSIPIAAIVRDSQVGVHPWLGIILEINEDGIARDISAAHEIATQLRIHGIALAIDDFGKGFSHLSRLKELPFIEMKLNRRIVIGSGIDPTREALCKSAVDLAHRFGSLAVAGGVEDRSDLEAVRRAGCDMAQGYLFGEVMPKDALLSRLMATGAGAGFAPILATPFGDGFKASA